MTARVLLIDNYDSFTYNLAHGIGRAGRATSTCLPARRADRGRGNRKQPTHLVISPGPGRPTETGIRPT